jgi:hypothetical protein
LVRRETQLGWKGTDWQRRFNLLVLPAKTKLGHMGNFAYATRIILLLGRLHNFDFSRDPQIRNIFADLNQQSSMLSDQKVLVSVQIIEFNFICNLAKLNLRIIFKN